MATIRSKEKYNGKNVRPRSFHTMVYSIPFSRVHNYVDVEIGDGGNCMIIKGILLIFHVELRKVVACLLL